MDRLTKTHMGLNCDLDDLIYHQNRKDKQNGQPSISKIFSDFLHEDQ